MNGQASLSPPRVYMALETETEEREHLQFLTTHVMRWSGDIWIMDISPFFHYWQTRAQTANSSVIRLWRAALNQVFEMPAVSDREKVTPISPAYRASCAVNPWLAVLMLYGMQSKNIRGLVPQQSRFGQTLLQSISWECWWRGTSAISDHFLAAKTRGFKPAKFRKQCHRLKLGMTRLGFRRPAEMHILNETGVKKRFGPELGLIWRWTFDRHSGESRKTALVDGGSEHATLFLYRTGFPWQGVRFRESPLIRRCLEYPLERWEQVAPQLNEDLDKLCLCLDKSGERVSRIDWFVTFEDLSHLHVPIRFRNPHDLLGESGNHRTTLLQANYAFEAAAREKFPPPSGSEETAAVPPLSNWELVLSETLVVPNVFFDIFGGIAEKEGDLDILLRLENELPVALNRFSTRRDWLPEDSYNSRELAWRETENPSADMQRSLDAVAEERPLYIRSQPLLLTGVERKTRGCFLESTLDKWWQKGEPAAIERNYFKHVDPDGNATWIFQDSAGNWYQHGIFG
ncbi:MAG: hypothetical protein ABIK68_12445 [bacterium]